MTRGDACGGASAGAVHATPPAWKSKIYKSSQPPLQHRLADKGPGCSWQQVYREIERLPLKHGDPAAALADCCLTVLLLSGRMSLRAAAAHSIHPSQKAPCHAPTVIAEVNETAPHPPPPIPPQSTVRKHHGVIHTVGQLLRGMLMAAGH